MKARSNKSINGASHTHRRRKGFALILTSLMLVFIVALMGMAVDAGILFAVRARLGAAADSAALAALRSLHLAVNPTDANNRATQAALRFLKANFPDDYLGVDPSQTQIAAGIAPRMEANRPTGLLEINVKAQVAAPVYFMKFWGVSRVPVKVEGRATRRNVVLMVVLDKSSSMGTRLTAPGTLPATLAPNATACEGMVFAASQLPDFFSPYDHLGMVSYHHTASTDFPASTGFKGAGAGSLKHRISEIACGNATNTTAALEAAYQEIQRVDQRQALNAILLLTDGIPNGVDAVFPLRALQDTRLGPADPASLPPGHPDQADCTDESGKKECTNMPVVCPNGTATGVITQEANFALDSGGRGGLFPSFPGEAPSSFPQGCPSSGTKMTSQSLAYIPEQDRFGNSTRGPKDNWALQVNEQCAPADLPLTSGNSRCKNTGGEWAHFADQWAGRSPGTNFFTAGPYAGKLRPDHANAIGAASLNTTINAAVRIRANASYKIRIDTVYLQGNGQDPLDRDFLPMISNLENIPALSYQPAGTPGKPNPLYNSSLPQGSYTQTANVQEMGSVFADIAASLLRAVQ